MELEDRNFRIESAEWEMEEYGDITYKVSPEKDVYEIMKISGSKRPALVGQQLFTFDAAMRETTKVGKRIPTREEWESFESNCPYEVRVKGLVFIGTMCWYGKYALFHGRNYELSERFWSSNCSGEAASVFVIQKGGNGSRMEGTWFEALNKLNGCLVRCIK